MKNKKFIFSLFIILFIIFFIILTNLIFYDTTKLHDDNRNEITIEQNASDSFNIINFWHNELKRVNNTNLRLEIGKNSSLDYTDPYTEKEYHFIAQEVAFESPNWVGALPSTLHIHGYLLYPENLKNKNPGALCLHGLNGNANQSFPLAYNLLKKGVVVLTFSFPGHGKSEGPKPSHKNFYYEGKFNESSFFYLSICSAIQALRALENFTIVDNSKIIVIGGSFGGLNALWLTGICGERIIGTHVLGALGDFNAAIEDPTKLIFWVLNKSPPDVPNDWWNHELPKIDPMYYLEFGNIPPILFSIGTNDEFFYYKQINGTYDVVNNTEKFIQLYPNEHHGFPKWENNSEFFINYVIFNGSRPPQIDVQKHKKEYNIFGNILKISVGINSEIKIKSVLVCYKYLDIIGMPWNRAELKKNKENERWEGEISPSFISSKVDYYIIVNLEGEENVWFSSKIYTAGVIISNFTIPFWLLFIAFISIPSFLIIRKRYYSEIKNNDLGPNIRNAKKYFIIELIALGIIEFCFYISFILPWVILESGNIVWTHIYFFNNIYTWERYFGFVSYFLTFAFIIGWIIYSQLSLKKPILAGIIKIMYPIFTFCVFGFYIARLNGSSVQSSAQLFGTGYPGLGMYLMLFSSLSTIILGIWKKIYKRKLNIPNSTAIKNNHKI
ncbi:MAG: alpha/beta hydrolase family protein [Promethearchaeota archaeon]